MSRRTGGRCRPLLGKRLCQHVHLSKGLHRHRRRALALLQVALPHPQQRRLLDQALPQHPPRCLRLRARTWARLSRGCRVWPHRLLHVEFADCTRLCHDIRSTAGCWIRLCRVPTDTRTGDWDCSFSDGRVGGSAHRDGRSPPRTYWVTPCRRARVSLHDCDCADDADDGAVEW